MQTAIATAIVVDLPLTGEPPLERMIPQPMETRADQEQEGAAYTDALNRIQQAFYRQHNRFAQDLRELTAEAIVPVYNSANYQYSTHSTAAWAEQRGEANPTSLRSYVGRVVVSPQGQTASILCRTIRPAGDLRSPIERQGRLHCAPGTELVQEYPG